MPAMNLNIARAPTVRAEGVRSKMDGSTFALKWNSSGCTGQVFFEHLNIERILIQQQQFFCPLADKF
jgi:hypothetical protein